MGNGVTSIQEWEKHFKNEKEKKMNISTQVLDQIFDHLLLRRFDKISLYIQEDCLVIKSVDGEDVLITKIENVGFETLIEILKVVKDHSQLDEINTKIEFTRKETA